MLHFTSSRSLLDDTTHLILLIHSRLALLRTYVVRNYIYIYLLYHTHLPVVLVCRCSSNTSIHPPHYTRQNQNVKIFRRVPRLTQFLIVWGHKSCHINKLRSIENSSKQSTNYERYTPANRVHYTAELSFIVVGISRRELNIYA